MSTNREPLDRNADTVQPGTGSSSADATPPPSTIGPYEIGEVLGRGGMAVVYRARHTELGRDFAIKL
ncbi:MAG: hypothetical protein ACYTGX_09300, partial [Planctomycetota bacterium]